MNTNTIGTEYLVAAHTDMHGSRTWIPNRFLSGPRRFPLLKILKDKYKNDVYVFRAEEQPAGCFISKYRHEIEPCEYPIFSGHVSHSSAPVVIATGRDGTAEAA